MRGSARGRRRVVRAAAVACVAALAVTGAAGQALGSAPGQGPVPATPQTTTQARLPAAGGPSSTSGQSARSVTLVTGDVVRVRGLGNGRRAVSVSPGSGRAGVGFHRFRRGGDLHVVPADAMAYVASGRVDEALFNVSELFRQGYGDGKHETLPLIATYRGKASMRSAEARAGAKRTARLESINGRGLAADKDRAGEFWRSVRGQQAGAAGAGSPQLAGGLKRVWLDARVHASLQKSTRQIGAPQAWSKGLTGKGATVAVLDTGIDASHPDLQNQVQGTKNFTPTDSTTDRFGHGTHVASIVAGDGAASAGKQQGVAHGADLVAGKVLGNSGYGQTSWIIDGMEWAAARAGADVVNMSLGGAATDGTDPISMAVNQLTANTGTLFAISAGNAGAPRTIGSPGAASKALTVGAVNADDRLAEFSSRGPRLGDYAIKPDVTAPGVDIAAARADGTSLGDPLGKYYTRLSGTSMAAPHAAGAAAILAAQHPRWEGPRIKAALMNSAVPTQGESVYAQGAGRVDVADATSQQVIAQPGSVSAGYFRYPHDDDQPAIRNVTYTNTGNQPVTLDLALDLQTKQGDEPPGGMVTLSRTTVTVPPGKNRKISVTVDTREGPVGLYGGTLTATRAGGSQAAGQTVARTPVGFYKEPEMYNLTIRGLGRDGQAAVGTAEIFGVDEPYQRQPFQSFTADGTATFRVPPGTYNAMAYLTQTGSQGRLNSLALAGDPQVEVTGDTIVAVDGSDANRITVDTPRPSRPKSGTIAYHRAAGQRALTSSFSVGGKTARHLYAAPTERVTEGDFEFYNRFRRVPPAGQTSAESQAAARPYLYDLMLPEPGRIPADLTYHVTKGDLARVDNQFYAQGNKHTGGEGRFAFRPYSFAAFATISDLALPSSRTEWVSAGDTRWSQMVQPHKASFAGQQETMTRYRPGQHLQQTWLQQPARPGTNPAQGARSYRKGNTLTLDIAAFRDAAPDHYGFALPGDTTRARLYRNGNLVADRNHTSGRFPAPPESADYRLVTDISRHKNWWTLSTRTHSAWHFTSQRPEQSRTVLPLINLRYDLNLDARRAPAGKPFTITMHATHQRGAANPPSISGVKLRVSYNDGNSWTPIEGLHKTGDGTYQTTITHPPKGQTSGYVSLRAQARDGDGNQIDQTIIRAYKLHPAGQ